MKNHPILILLLASLGCTANAVEMPAKWHVGQVVGRSMLPTLKAGDIVLIDESVSFDSLQVGDVISFHDGREIVLHRIAEVNRAGNGERWLRTKGDNNRFFERVMRAQYRGRAWPQAQPK